MDKTKRGPTYEQCGECKAGVWVNHQRQKAARGPYLCLTCKRKADGITESRTVAK